MNYTHFFFSSKICFFSEKVVRAPTNNIIVTIYYLRDICIGQNNHNQQYIAQPCIFGTLLELLCMKIGLKESYCLLMYRQNHENVSLKRSN